MRIKLISIFTLLTVFLAFGIVSAMPNHVSVTVRPSGQTISIPPRALEVAPHVFSLGTALDPESNQLVDGYVIVHAKGGDKGKPDKPGGGKPNENSCSEPLAKGAKWRGAAEPWIVNTSNIDSLGSSFVFDTLAAGIDKWEDAADGTVGDANSIDILGDGSITLATLVADMVQPDGKNEVYFANVDSQGAIAITVVWGIFGGRPSQRVLVEWDQVYDDVDYDWGDADVDPLVMDLDNIGTHELGHSVGLADLYTVECSQETMYGYGAEGETLKRDLNAGDIAGVSNLY